MSCFDTGSRVMVGGLSRQRLLAALDSAEVRLNDHARVLIAGPAFDRRDPEPIRVITRSLSTLGLTSGGTLRQIFSTAESRGLHPCPPDSGPYLRIAWLSQPQSHDSVQSTGRAPAGAVTIASEPIDETFATPKGFYLRLVDGQAWLRAYRCDEAFEFSADHVFAFRAD